VSAGLVIGLVPHVLGLIVFGFFGIIADVIVMALFKAANALPLVLFFISGGTVALALWYALGWFLG
jgi:hypothetical protein